MQYWAAQGCNLNDPKSVKAFLMAKELRKTNVQKARERGKNHQDSHREDSMRSTGSSAPVGNGDTPVGEKGAQHALSRLEAAEESAHRRLQAALARGNPIGVQACQDFWLKCSETLRRLDLAVEVARRSAEGRSRRNWGKMWRDGCELHLCNF